MVTKTAIAFLIALSLPVATHAKIFLLLDERLKKSPLEQSIYRFVPLTNAAEVELNYVQNFLKEGGVAAFAAGLKKNDRAIYIGADRWPEDTYINRVTADAGWTAIAGKVSFLVENNAPDFVRPPRGFYPRRELWKKYAEATATRHAGYLHAHYLDTTPVALNAGNWSGGYSCVHESGRELTATGASPLEIRQNRLRIRFRRLSQLAYLGHLVCINTPAADSILELHSVRTDVVLETDPGRFSLWNEAQPLYMRIQTAQRITMPLQLKIEAAENESETEFFFGGDRIRCFDRVCRKADGRFVLPAFSGLEHTFELAVRAPGESYFRGSMALMSGEIEIARAPVRFTPMSLVSEAAYAFRNPSEYRLVFLAGLAAALALVLLFLILRRFWRKMRARLAARREAELPRQLSASVQVRRGTSYRITAGENPFGCELLCFGGIVALAIEGETVVVRHGGVAQSFALEGFRYLLPDGYVLEIKSPGDGTLVLLACYFGHMTAIAASAES